jgi:uncharacterized protein
MNSRPIDPRRLDMAAFAAADGELSGELALEGLARLAESVIGMEPPGAPVHWQAEGRMRSVAGGEAETWLHLSSQACVSLRCQRCLQPMAAPLDVDRWIRFVRDAAEAEALDAELEDDVLELPRQLDLHELIEDELLLALPLVPRHEVCPEPLPQGSDPEVDVPERPNPFAALEQLKKKKPGT